MILPFHAEPLFHLRMRDIEIDNERDDEKQNARRQNHGTLEKHKGLSVSMEKLIFNYFQNKSGFISLLGGTDAIASGRMATSGGLCESPFSLASRRLATFLDV